MKISGRFRFSPTVILLLLILLLALVLRLIGFTFGLPSLYDPDEPFFLITGFKLLRDHSLNPGWFGHPGTTTIYALALIELAIVTTGNLTGRLPDIHAFGHAVYADTALIFVPARLFIIACGITCVFLTFLVGRRLAGDRVGLAAAGLLAINPLHIVFSQIIRTDVHASVFLLLCALSCIEIVRRGRPRDYLLAALWVGLACATKWPAATVGVAIPGACFARCRAHPEEIGRQLVYLLLAGCAAIAALFVASPYIFLDYQTVLTQVGGEAQPRHLGATGGSFFPNLLWYVSHPLRSSIGSAGLALAAIGIVSCLFRHPAARVTIVLASAVFLIAICAQSLVWSRWIVPMLPFASIFIAIGVWNIVDRVRAAAGQRAALSCAVAILAGVALPMATAVAAEAHERLNDTRAMASAWARAHIPGGSTVLVEYFAFDLLPQNWQLIFPAGRLGCIDVNKVLKGRVVRSTTVDGWRGDRPIVDIGTIDVRMLGVCHADYAILTDYDRYKAEQPSFRHEVAVYETLIHGAVSLATFRPVAGAIGGPVVRIIRLGPTRAPAHRLS
jgi:hypothetical protein